MACCAVLCTIIALNLLLQSNDVSWFRCDLLTAPTWCLQAVTLRYGEVGELDLLARLTGAVSASLSPHWLGLIDLNGQMGLQQLLDAAATAANNRASAADGKRKVELTAQQLPDLLGQESGAK
jgi:hypothetical protein